MILSALDIAQPLRAKTGRVRPFIYIGSEGFDTNVGQELSILSSILGSTLARRPRMFLNAQIRLVNPFWRHSFELGSSKMGIQQVGFHKDSSSDSNSVGERIRSLLEP